MKTSTNCKQNAGLTVKIISSFNVALRSFILVACLFVLGMSKSGAQSLNTPIAGDFRSIGTPVSFTATTNWQTYDGANWNAAVSAPVSGTTASYYIQSNHTLNASTFSCLNLYVSTGTVAGTAAPGVIAVTTNTLTIAGSIEAFFGAVTTSGAFPTLTLNAGTTTSFYNITTTAGSGTVTFTGATPVVAGGWSGLYTGTWTAVFNFAGTVTMATNFSSTSLTTSASTILNMGVNTYTNITGTLSNSGTFQTGSTTNPPFTASKTWGGSVEFTALTGGQTIPTTSTFNNLQLDNTSGIDVAAGTEVVNGTLTVPAGGTLNMVTFALGGATIVPNVSGTIQTQATASAIPTPHTYGGTIQYNATTGAQSIITNTYNNLSLLNTSGTQTASGNLTVNGALTTTASGTLAMGTFQLLGTFSGGVTSNASITTSCPANPAIPNGFTWGATVTYSVAAGGQYVAGGTYTTLTLSNSTGTDTATGNISATTITATGGASGTLNMLANKLTVNTTLTNTGTIQTQNTSAAPFALPNTTYPGTFNYNNITGGQSVLSGTYTTLTFGNTSGTSTALGNINCTTLNTTAGGIFDLSTFQLLTVTTATGTLGTIQTENTSGTPVPSAKTWGTTGTFIYNVPTGGQTIMGGTYGTLTINNTSGVDSSNGVAITTNGNLNTSAGGTFYLTSTGVLTVNGTTNVNGTFNFKGAASHVFVGLVTISNGASWIEVAAITPSFRGGITNNGTFTASTGAHAFNTNSQALTGTFSIPSVTVTSPTVLTNTNSLTVATTLTGTGALTQGAGSTLTINGASSGLTGALTASAVPNTVNYNVTAAQAIKGTTYYNLNVSEAATFAVTLNALTTINNNLSVSGGGTFADGGFQITGNGTGTLTVNNGATLQIGAASAVITTFPTLFTTANTFLNSGSTVNYSTTTNEQFIATSIAGVGPAGYGSLTITGASGVKTATGPFTVAGNLFVSGTTTVSTFSDSSFVITVNGNVNNTGIISGSGEILLSGGAATHLVSANSNNGSYAFTNIELNDSLGAQLDTCSLTVTGTIKLTNGKMEGFQNNLLLVVSDTAKTVRTGGYLNGLEAKYFPKGRNLSFTFDVDLISRPVTLAFDTVIIRGAIIEANIGSAKDANIGTSGLDATKGVNTYWLLYNSNIPASFGNATITFNYLAGDIDGAAIQSDFLAQRYNTGTTMWSDTGTVTNPTATSTTVVTASLGTSNVTQHWAIADPSSSFSFAASASPAIVCSDNFTVSVDPLPPPTPDYTYQWQSSETGQNYFLDIPGATASSYSSNDLTTSTDFRCNVTFKGTPLASGTPATVSTYGGILTTDDGSRSCAGSVALYAYLQQPVSGGSSTVKWYTAPAGGTSVGSGTLFNTPFIDTTTTFYAEPNTTYNATSGQLGMNCSYVTSLACANRVDSVAKCGLVFNVTRKMNLASVDMMGTGLNWCTLVISGSSGLGFTLQNSAGVTVTSLNTPGFIGTNPTTAWSTYTSLANNQCGGTNTFLINWTIPPGNGYRIVYGGASASTQYAFCATGAGITSYPYNLTLAGNSYGSITNGINSGGIEDDNTYYYFYDWIIKDAGVCVGPRTPVVATVNPQSPVGGTVSASPTTLCVSGTSMLTLTGISGTIQWYVSTDSLNFTAISGATSSTYTTPAITATRYYMTQVNTGGSCNSVSNVVKVTVSPASVGGTASANPFLICTGNSTITLTGSTGNIQWQTSPDSITFTNIPGANASTYSTPALTSSAYYRAVVTNGVCAGVNSTVAKVTATSINTAGFVNQTICTNGNVTFTAADPGAGNSIEWSTDGITNNDGSSAGGSGPVFSPPKPVTLGNPITEYARTSSPFATSQTFTYNGAQQTFTVPAGVTSITYDVRGAQGGYGYDSTHTPVTSCGSYGSGSGIGGNGGRVTATMSVTPGQTFFIYVGQAGGNASAGTSAATGGDNSGGGATGGSGGIRSGGSINGGGGGASSDIRSGGTALSNRIVVAGGGAGGSGNCSGGALGGGTTGGNYANLGAPYGLGGTQAAGGAAGINTTCADTGVAGVLGIGGNGAASASCGSAGGGGGGGYYGGGGGGGNGGGGGGSSYTDPSLTTVVHTQGFQASNGTVIISYIQPDLCKSPWVSATGSVAPCNFNFTLNNLFLQGYYLGGGKMSPLLHLLGVPGSAATDVDTVTIFVHNNTSPYNPIDTAKGVLQSNGTVVCNFKIGTVGNYYLAVVHRNGITTWSPSTVSLISNGNYDFSAGGGYNGSMVALDGTYKGIYSGDVNQDGSINAADKSSIQGLLSSFLIGVYNVNDITGDGFVDEDDYRIMLKNAQSGITVQHP